MRLALLSGVVIQWLTKPEQAPGGRAVVRGLGALAGAVVDEADGAGG